MADAGSDSSVIDATQQHYQRAEVEEDHHVPRIQVQDSQENTTRMKLKINTEPKLEHEPAKNTIQTPQQSTKCNIISEDPLARYSDSLVPYSITSVDFPESPLPRHAPTIRSSMDMTGGHLSAVDQLYCGVDSFSTVRPSHMTDSQQDHCRLALCAESSLHVVRKHLDEEMVKQTTSPRRLNRPKIQVPVTMASPDRDSPETARGTAQIRWRQSQLKSRDSRVETAAGKTSCQADTESTHVLSGEVISTLPSSSPSSLHPHNHPAPFTYTHPSGPAHSINVSALSQSPPPNHNHSGRREIQRIGRTTPENAVPHNLTRRNWRHAIDEIRAKAFEGHRHQREDNFRAANGRTHVDRASSPLNPTQVSALHQQSTLSSMAKQETSGHDYSIQRMKSMHESSAQRVDYTNEHFTKQVERTRDQTTKHIDYSHDHSADFNGQTRMQFGGETNDKTPLPDELLTQQARSSILSHLLHQLLPHQTLPLQPPQYPAQASLEHQQQKQSQQPQWSQAGGKNLPQGNNLESLLQNISNNLHLWQEQIVNQQANHQQSLNQLDYTQLLKNSHRHTDALNNNKEFATQQANHQVNRVQTDKTFSHPLAQSSPAQDFSSQLPSPSPINSSGGETHLAPESAVHRDEEPSSDRGARGAGAAEATVGRTAPVSMLSAVNSNLRQLLASLDESGGQDLSQSDKTASVSAEKVANKAQFDGSESSQTCSSFLDTLVKKIGNKMDLISDKLYSNGELVKAQAISEANQIYRNLTDMVNRSHLSDLEEINCNQKELGRLMTTVACSLLSLCVYLKCPSHPATINEHPSHPAATSTTVAAGIEGDSGGEAYVRNVKMKPQSTSNFLDFNEPDLLIREKVVGFRPDRTTVDVQVQSKPSTLSVGSQSDETSRSRSNSQPVTNTRTRTTASEKLVPRRQSVPTSSKLHTRVKAANAIPNRNSKNFSSQPKPNSLSPSTLSPALRPERAQITGHKRNRKPPNRNDTALTSYSKVKPSVRQNTSQSTSIREPNVNSDMGGKVSTRSRPR